MSALSEWVWEDSVEENTLANPGTGAIILGGATAGNRPFSVIPDGKKVDYRAETADLTVWEIGSAIYDSGTNSLTRGAVYENSLGTTSHVNLTGVCTVFLSFLSRRIVRIGGVLPLVTGALPGPDFVTDGNGECVGVPL